MNLRILFVGAVEFSRHCLEMVLNSGGDVAAVLTLAREDAEFHSDYADLTETAKRTGVPIHYVKNINDKPTLEMIESLNPDVIFVFGWSQLISRRILAVPSLGCIGTHPALLPRHRGRHPLIWTLIEGLRESGLTFFYLDEKADAGDILWQKPFPITADDDAGTLYQKIKDLATEAIPEFLPQLRCGKAPRIRQDHSQATYWRKRTEKDWQIDWNAPTGQIHNLVRALTRPYAGAHTYSDGTVVKIWRSHIPDNHPTLEPAQVEPGVVVASTREICMVRTGDGYLNVSEYEPMEPCSVMVGTRFGGHP